MKVSIIVPVYNGKKYINKCINSILKQTPPFNAIEGLGDTVANNIVEEREKGPFISIEEFQIRCKVSGTLIDKMKLMGIFGGMPETSQLSLF